MTASRPQRIVAVAAGALGVAVVGFVACAVAEQSNADHLKRAIRELFFDPSNGERGLAFDDSDLANGRYGTTITVNFTGNEYDSVDRQIATTAETALRIGYLVLQGDFEKPKDDLIIKMALKKSREFGFIDTFSVRYHWGDVLAAAKADASIAQLAAKGKVQQIWLEYWPTMCLNPPPPELFAGGYGAPEAPEAVENPKGKDLSCHRKR